MEVEEKLTYRREIVIGIPDEMEESQLDRILDIAQRNEFLEDFVYDLKDFGIECLSGYSDDLSSPNSGEVECDWYEFIEEGEQSA